MNTSSTAGIKTIKLYRSGHYVPNTVPRTLHPWFDVLRSWDPAKQATWPRARGSRAGGRRPATPWRDLPHILFGPFINIIVREHVCFIVTCSILVHPVFLEKWISLSLFIQDNKTKQKRPENNIGLMEAILTVRGNVPESISSVRDIPS